MIYLEIVIQQIRMKKVQNVVKQPLVVTCLFISNAKHRQKKLISKN